VTVFNDFDIDGCCGGSVPVREAAIRDGADPEAVFAALLKTIASAV
jgi:iron-sulfur cluster repair protein YtfE (RIC family)